MANQNVNKAMEAALGAVALFPLAPKQPQDNKDYVNLKQLLELAKAAYTKADIAVLLAQDARRAADSLFRELQVRVEIMEIEMGVRLDHSNCDGSCCGGEGEAS